jgi:hypothetical protein
LPKCARSSGAGLSRRHHPGLAVVATFASLPLLALLALPAAGLAAADIATVPGDVLPVGDFAGTPRGALPADWRELTFPNIKAHTRYSIVADAEQGQVVRADATASASGLVRRVDADPRTWPVLRWRWKADRLVERGDVATKAGDDYPARVYVSFAYDPSRVSLLERAWYAVARFVYGEYPPQSGLNYIWDGKAPAGAIVANAYTGRVRMIVVESGPARLGRWLQYERNILDDYAKAFGGAAPAISGIAIMTDTDNTGESVTAWYGNVELAKAR